VFQINPLSRTSIYQQIIDQIEEYITTGLWKAGDPLPSVRTVSVESAINPNTVQKAYNELAGKGIILSVPGRGSFVSEDAFRVVCREKRKQLGEFRRMIGELLQAGVTPDELIAEIQDVSETKESSE